MTKILNNKCCLEISIHLRELITYAILDIKRKTGGYTNMDIHSVV